MLAVINHKNILKLKMNPYKCKHISRSWIHWAELNFPRDCLATVSYIYLDIASFDLPDQFKTVYMRVHL